MKAVSLYRFFNSEVNKYGEPFALCATHAAEQKVPEACFLEMIAKEALQKCRKCVSSAELAKQEEEF